MVASVRAAVDIKVRLLGEALVAVESIANVLPDLRNSPLGDDKAGIYVDLNGLHKLVDVGDKLDAVLGVGALAVIVLESRGCVVALSTDVSMP
ncbi:hypothetical protein GMORB2_4369 [Geosmithia morbida]|uniref:Uncharacterized protein n=1 Tax=Geosmithia morbida TaxID=1094350 RepID=A0A9P4Z161_9HYPO|nr:uncharacterized protein GMORB2_4369 [Geosmithia morbida]KAF4125529.1 hypothetical protein GMORB2_4369 [Geosmithia morbida]